MMMMTMMMCKAHSHKDGSGHSDRVEWIEKGGEEVDVETRLESKSTQLKMIMVMILVLFFLVKVQL